MLFIVVAYDISDDKRRQEISNLLSLFGQRVNYSVFECVIKEKDLPYIKGKIKKIIERKEDCVIYYRLCPHCAERIEREGQFTPDRSWVRVI